MSTEQELIDGVDIKEESEIPTINNKQILIPNNKDSTNKVKPISHKRGKIQATIEKKQEQAQRAKENKETKSKINSTNIKNQPVQTKIVQSASSKTAPKKAPKNDKFDKFQIDEDVLSAYR